MYDANPRFMDDLKHLHFYRTFRRAIFPQTSVLRVTKNHRKLPGFPKFGIVGSTFSMKLFNNRNSSTKTIGKKQTHLDFQSRGKNRKHPHHQFFFGNIEIETSDLKQNDHNLPDRWYLFWAPSLVKRWFGGEYRLPDTWSRSIQISLDDACCDWKPSTTSLNPTGGTCETRCEIWAMKKSRES